MVFLNADGIIEIHQPTSLKKLDAIIASMEANGYVGRPILAFEDGSGGAFAITGSHRLAAARALDIEVPVHFVDYDATEVQVSGQYLCEVVGTDDDLVYEFLTELGDDEAAKLMMEEIDSNYDDVE